MATFNVRAPKELAEKLDRLQKATAPAAKKAIFEAAAITTDKIRHNIKMLPEDQARVLKSGEVFKGVPASQKKDLLNSLGITKIDYDAKGFWNVRIGFDGYGSYPTRKYPKGVPNQLLARSIESGSSVRKKTPFSRPAVQSVKKLALQAIEDTINDAFKKA